MTTTTAVENVNRYILMLENGNATEAARSRCYRSLGHLKAVANYMHYGHYAEWGKQEDRYKQEEAEHGADITTMRAMLTRKRATI